MSKPIGGRGHKSIETTHVRIPVPLKSRVQELVNEFHTGTLEQPVNKFPSLAESVDLAQEILARKKSARLSLEKLLTAIYGTEVSL